MSNPSIHKSGRNSWVTMVSHVITCPGTTVLRDGYRVRIERTGQTVRIGCHLVSMDALKRILEIAEGHGTQDGHE
jgi:hypothetical protein